MNPMIQNMLQQMMKQAPQKMMNQLGQQLKRVNPQAFQEYQKARQNNENPQEYLNKITGGFNQEQQEQWQQMMGMFNQPK